MKYNTYIYIAIMAAVTLAIRILPLTLIRRKFTNRFFKSFLYYVPYATLSVMTFPAIINTTNSPVTGVAALILGIVAAWRGASLFAVAVLCCATVFALDFIF